MQKNTRDSDIGGGGVGGGGWGGPAGGGGGARILQWWVWVGGFGASVGPAGVPNSAMKGARGRAVGGRGRVGFGNVSQFG